VVIQLRGVSKANNCLAGKVDGREARHQLAEDGGMVEERQPKLKKMKRWAPARDPETVNIINKTLGQIPVQPSATTASQQRASPDMDSLLQAEIAREELTGLLGYVHEMEKKQKRHHNTTASISNEGLPRYNGTSTLVQGYSRIFQQNNSLPSSLSPKPPQQTLIYNLNARNSSRREEVHGLLRMMEASQFHSSTLFPNQSSARYLGLLVGSKGALIICRSN
jgi:hypothetical protein